MIQSIFMLHYFHPFEWSLISSIWILYNNIKMVYALRCATVRYTSTEWSKYSNCTVIPSKYGKENQWIHFHHHCQAHLIHYFGQEQVPLLKYVIQCRIQVRFAWPRQNVTWLTQMTRSGFNSDVYSMLTLGVPEIEYSAFLREEMKCLVCYCICTV